MLAKYKIDLEKTTLVQYIIVGLLILVYAGVFTIPLADNDAAHCADIALHMYHTGDYHSLMDRGMNYLDKPHFLFWVAAFSFKVFGVNTFAYRLPVVLFGLVSVVSVYKLTKHLSDSTTAKLSALILATTQAFVFSVINARVEAPLMAAIAFGLWQLTVYVDEQKTSTLLLAAIGTAVAFDTEGWTGAAVIIITCFFKILVEKKWRVFTRVKTYLFVPVFLLFISPVLYSFYLQYDMHPDIVVRGMSHISGVTFILWNQNFVHSSSNNSGQGSNYFSPYYTFLWAFAPWCIAAYLGVWYWLRRLFYKKKNHPVTYMALSFAIILFVSSFSGFTMQDYILILFPLSAVFTAPYLRLALSSKLIKFFFPLQVILGYLTIVATLLLNFYFFKPVTDLVAIAGIGLLITLFILVTFKDPRKAMKVVYVSALLSITFNFFITFNFYPNLMQYQGGSGLAKMLDSSSKQYAASDIKLIDSTSYSFDFYMAKNHEQVGIDSIMQHYNTAMAQQRFLLTSYTKRKLETQGFLVQPEFAHSNYNTGRVKADFLNKKTRASACDSLMIVTIRKL